MPPFDEAAAAALAGKVVRPAYFAWLDFADIDEPFRVTTAGYPVTFAGTGDPDLDGFTFDPVNPQLVEIGAVEQGESGSQPLTCTLSAIGDLDAEIFEIVADRARWQGRVGRFWRMERDADGAPIGLITAYHTGYMASLEHVPSPTDPVFKLRLEGYLAAMTAQPSNRGYRSQKEFDPDDESGMAAAAAANGAKAGPGAATAVGGGGNIRHVSPRTVSA